MSEKPSSKIVVTVVSGLILAGLLFLFKSYLPPILSWAWSVITAIWNWLFSPHDVGGWLIVILTAAFLAVLAEVVRRLRRSDTVAEEDWRSFTEADFLGFRWRWNYEYGGDFDYIAPFCADRTCDLQLTPKTSYRSYGGDHTELSCARCGYTKVLEIHPEDLQANIRREIHRLVRTGQWTTAKNKDA